MSKPNLRTRIRQAVKPVKQPTLVHPFDVYRDQFDPDAPQPEPDGVTVREVEKGGRLTVNPEAQLMEAKVRARVDALRAIDAYKKGQR